MRLTLLWRCLFPATVVMRKRKRPTFQNVEQPYGLQPNTILKLVDITTVFLTINDPIQLFQNNET